MTPQDTHLGKMGSAHGEAFRYCLSMSRHSYRCCCIERSTSMVPPVSREASMARARLSWFGFAKYIIEITRCVRTQLFNLIFNEMNLTRRSFLLLRLGQVLFLFHCETSLASSGSYSAISTYLPRQGLVFILLPFLSLFFTRPD